MRETLLGRARVWLRSASGVGLSSAADIRAFLRIGNAGYTGAGGVLRLGTRSKFAAEPGTCDVAAVLSRTHPKISAIALRPSLLLKIPEEWDAADRPRIFAHLDRSYDQLIDDAASTGAVLLYDVQRLPRIAGAPLRGGGFAVPNDALEDRWISPLEETNALVDPAALPPVVYPYLPQLGSLLIKPGSGRLFRSEMLGMITPLLSLEKSGGSGSPILHYAGTGVVMCLSTLHGQWASAALASLPSR